MQKRDDLETACRNTVATAMQELGVKSRVSKAFTPTTTMADPSKRPAENLLDRDFTAEAPNCKWVTDITYLPTATGWFYLAVVLDLFGRKVVGWSISHPLGTGRWRPNWLARLYKKPLRIVVPMAASCCIMSVHQRRLPEDFANARHYVLDESPRKLLRQCREGTILLVTQRRIFFLPLSSGKFWKRSRSPILVTLSLDSSLRSMLSLDVHSARVYVRYCGDQRLMILREATSLSLLGRTAPCAKLDTSSVEEFF